MEKFSQSVLIRKLDVLCSLHNRRFMREISSPSSRASGKMLRSPRLAHEAPVLQAKSSVHGLVFIVFNYNSSIFLLQKFSV